MNDGGAAILIDNRINHHIVRDGVSVNIPFVKNVLRVWVIEYEIFAIIKRADEHRPWAIIIIRAPVIPHVDRVRAPAINSPICPTEE